MTDGISLKMSIDGVNYIRAVTCPGDGCVNLANARYIRSNYAIAKTDYENWSSCGGTHLI